MFSQNFPALGNWFQTEIYANRSPLTKGATVLLLYAMQKEWYACAIFRCISK